jgi:hypothetical protein
VSAAERERLLDLAVLAATEGAEALTAAELAALRTADLLGEVERLELAAAWLSGALEVGPPEPLPAPVEALVRAGVRGYLGAAPVQAAAGRPRSRRLAAVAAAALAIAGGWWLSGTTAAPPPRTAAEVRAELLAGSPTRSSSPGTRRPRPRARGTTGDVVWSTSPPGRLPAAPRAPAERPPRPSTTSSGSSTPRATASRWTGASSTSRPAPEVLAPIAARLRVDAPELFAITLERRGGVVVSEGPLLVVARAR